MVGRTIHVAAVTGALALAACSTNDTHGEREAMSRGDAASSSTPDATIAMPPTSDATTTPKPSSFNGECSDEPTVLVDPMAFTPDAGGFGYAPPAIAVRDGFVYFVVTWDFGIGQALPSNQGGVLMRIPVGGGAPERLANVIGLASNFAVASGFVVYAEASDDDNGTIMRVPLGGGPRTVLAKTHGIGTSLVTDDTDVFFDDADAVKSVPLAGGLVRTIATIVGNGIALIDDTLVLSDYGGTVASVPKSGGPITILARDQLGARTAMRCGAALCWADSLPMSGQLMRLAPGSQPETLSEDLIKISALAFDGENFFVTGSRGGITRISADGKNAARVEEPTRAVSVAFDEKCFFGSGYFGGIFSMSRKAADGDVP